MNDEQNRIKNRRKYLKLRKKHPWISIPVFLIALVVCAAVFLMLFELIIQILLESRLSGAAEHVSSLAAIYEDSGDDALQLLDKQKLSYVILDKDGNTLHRSGVVSYGSLHGFYSGGNDIYLYEDTSHPLLKADADGGVDFDYKTLFNALTEQLAVTIKFPNEKTIRLSETEYEKLENEDALDKLQDLGYEVEVEHSDRMIVSSEKAVSLPLWIAADIHDGSERMIMRTELTFLSSDLMTVLVFLVILLVVFLGTAGSLLADMIASFVNQARIRQLLFTDMTTGGQNRTWFLYRGEQILRSRFAGKNRFAVIDLNLVKYQSICLCHSIAEAERLLTEIQTKTEKILHKRELCAHNAEGSFALLLQYEEEDALAERVRRLITALQEISTDHALEFHAGIAPVSGSGIRPDRRTVDIELDFTNACSACETLDSSDESGTAFFDQKLVDEQKWVDTVTESEHKALMQEEFLVYYQPKYDPQTNTLRGAEALIRWQSPEFGFVSPGRFIPIFEKNGFITEIDHYMLRHVARDQRRWLDAGFNCVPVSVNVSRAHFIESDLAEQIRDIIDAEGTPHELIELELTESAFFDDKKAMIRTILKLKEYGFAVSMDDFGSGYSSLNSLKDMPLDVLKLDAEFFRGEEAGTDRGEIVVSEAIKLAKSLHMRTVAEGVEVKEQVEFLAEQGCDMIQGYYFAKPMPGTEFEQRMANGQAETAAVSLEKA